LQNDTKKKRNRENTMKQSDSKVLEQIPGVGKQIAQDMANIGEQNDLSRQKP